ncbi:hypothetical protein AKJ38_02245 [candidate division MSBL1 archaeon SCGC-AAA259I14]|uniref:Restriction endonuclease type IV Mrr domain-containing protein n=1 Tax=candidate division MSBL1 archaeon SCGC-AAA259I14 TaxID=1698268 RepID=A0A133URS5_9EURY|nr:hypothetical protein AKJ38_02245 [candidate division MSBL1 archaeon SCGC-AAA259I14]
MTGSKKRGTRFEYRVAYRFEDFGYSWDRSGSSLGVDLKVLEDGDLRFLVSCKKTSTKDVIYLPKAEVEDLADEAERRGAPGLICYGFYRTPVFVVPLENMSDLEQTEKSYKLEKSRDATLDDFLG